MLKSFARRPAQLTWRRRLEATITLRVADAFHALFLWHLKLSPSQRTAVDHAAASLAGVGIGSALMLVALSFAR